MRKQKILAAFGLLILAFLTQGYGYSDVDSIAVKDRLFLGPQYYIGESRISKTELLYYLKSDSLSSLHLFKSREHNSLFWHNYLHALGILLIGTAPVDILVEKGYENTGRFLFFAAAIGTMYKFYRAFENGSAMNREFGNAISAFNQSQKK